MIIKYGVGKTALSNVITISPITHVLDIIPFVTITVIDTEGTLYGTWKDLQNELIYILNDASTSYFFIGRVKDIIFETDQMILTCEGGTSQSEDKPFEKNYIYAQGKVKSDPPYAASNNKLELCEDTDSEDAFTWDNDYWITGRDNAILLTDATDYSSKVWDTSAGVVTNERGDSNTHVDTQALGGNSHSAYDYQGDGLDCVITYTIDGDVITEQPTNFLQQIRVDFKIGAFSQLVHGYNPAVVNAILEINKDSAWIEIGRITAGTGPGTYNTIIYTSDMFWTVEGTPTELEDYLTIVANEYVSVEIRLRMSGGTLGTANLVNAIHCDYLQVTVLYETADFSPGMAKITDNEASWIEATSVNFTTTGIHLEDKFLIGENTKLILADALTSARLAYDIDTNFSKYMARYFKGVNPKQIASSICDLEDAHFFEKYENDIPIFSVKKSSSFPIIGVDFTETVAAVAGDTITLTGNEDLGVNELAGWTVYGTGGDNIGSSWIIESNTSADPTIITLTTTPPGDLNGDTIDILETVYKGYIYDPITSTEYSPDYKIERPSNQYKETKVWGNVYWGVEATAHDHTAANTSNKTWSIVDDTIATQADAQSVANSLLDRYKIVRPSIKITLSGAGYEKIFPGIIIYATFDRPTIAKTAYEVRYVERTQGNDGINGLLRTTVQLGLGQSSDEVEYIGTVIQSAVNTAQKAHTDKLIPAASGGIPRQSHIGLTNVLPNQHHTATVAGDLSHDDIANPQGNADEQHLTAAQVAALHAEAHTLASHTTKLITDLSDVDADLSVVLKSAEETSAGAYPHDGTEVEGELHWDADENMLLRWNATAGAWIEIGGGAGLVGGNSLYLLLADAASDYVAKAGGTMTGSLITDGGHLYAYSNGTVRAYSGNESRYIGLYHDDAFGRIQNSVGAVIVNATELAAKNIADDDYVNMTANAFNEASMPLPDDPPDWKDKLPSFVKKDLSSIGEPEKIGINIGMVARLALKKVEELTKRIEELEGKK